MRCRDEHVLDEICLFRAHPLDTLAATVLATIGSKRHTLDVVVMRQRDDDIFLSNEVFDVDLRRINRELRTALIAILLLDCAELILDDAKDAVLVSQNGLELLDSLQDFLILLFDLLTLQTGQALQTQIQDSLSLFLRELETRHECFTGNISRAALTDGRDDSIQMIQRNRQAFEDMSPCLCLGQLIAGPAGNDVFLMLDVVVQDLLEVQHLRLAINQCQHDDAEAFLQLRMLIQLIQDNMGIGILAEVDDHPHTITV